jgi:hypothetical protein
MVSEGLRHEGHGVSLTPLDADTDAVRLIVRSASASIVDG